MMSQKKKENIEILFVVRKICESNCVHQVCYYTEYMCCCPTTRGSEFSVFSLIYFLYGNFFITVIFFNFI